MLTYSIVRQCLFGEVGATHFDILAHSGGARVNTRGLVQNSIESWDFNRTVNDPKSIRGGPLPPGLYSTHKPAHHPIVAEQPSCSRPVRPFFILI